MNTYGIPQTLLSIREYGGPKVEEDVPLLIENNLNKKNYILRACNIKSFRHAHILFSKISSS